MTSTLSLLQKIKVHPIFYAVLGIGVASGYFREVIMVFLIVFIHEMGHAVTAHIFKWRITKIELLPFGGVAEVNENGNRPLYEEFLIIIAGPIQHLWMIGLSFLLVGRVDFWTMSEHQLFVWHNVVILCFNLLPIWPLDGGRLVHLLYSYYFPYKKAQKINLISSFSFLLLTTILAFQLYPFHLNLWVVLSFLFLSNYLEWKQRHFSYMRFLMERLQYNKSKKTKIIYVSATMKVQEVVERFERGRKHMICIQRTNKRLKETDVLKAFYYEKKLHHPIGTLL